MEQTKYGISAPYLKGEITTGKIMICIILALIPAAIHGIFRYGANAGLFILLTCISAVVTDMISQIITKKQVTLKNGRALLTGLLTAYCMPPTIPWYLALLAGVLCTLIMQISLHFFSRNVVSPVILTRLIFMFAFPMEMSNYVLDGISTATPLAVYQGDGIVNPLHMILGNTGGCIGESSALLLCLGAIFLILVGIIDFRVTGMYLFSFVAFLTVFGGEGLSSYYLTVQLAGGGFMLALWFIAPAYSSIPITKGGRLLYGMILGILSGFFRLYGPSVENLCYAILIANLLVPVIEKITVPRAFGVEKGHL